GPSEEAAPHRDHDDRGRRGREDPDLARMTRRGEAMRTTSRWALSAALGAALAATGVGSAAVRAVDTEDDLAVVKRAVAQSPWPEGPAPPATAARLAGPSSP